MATSAPPQARDKSQVMARMSEKLVAGWALLSTHCPMPNCATPLMRSRDGTIWCPACDIQCIAEGQPTPSAAEEQRQQNQQQEAPPQQSNELPPISAEYADWQQKRERVSAELGTRMLAGWAMLAEACPSPACRGTPLMRKKGGPMLCVCCENTYSMDEDGELHAVQGGGNETKTSTPTTTATTTADRAQKPKQLPPNSPIRDERRAVPQPQSKALDASQLIADKLLLGWAMLNETCEQPGCTGEAPLMRDHSKRKHCLLCGNVVESEAPHSKQAETKKQLQKGEEHIATAPRNLPTPPNPVAETEMSSAPQPTQSPIQVAARLVERTPISSPQRVSTTATRSVAEDVQSILHEISRTTGQLASVAHPSDGIALAEYISKLAEAAAAVQRLQLQLEGHK